ncbi:MAG: hypothetical protein ACI9VR_001705 [Cognaticolwellia sp.]|jgi:hypothetical protein
MKASNSALSQLDASRPAVKGREPEATPLQPAIEQVEGPPVPPQQLQRSTSSVVKHKQVSAGRVRLQHGLDLPGESVYRLSKVRVLNRKMDPCVAEIQQRAAISRRSSWSSKPGGIWIHTSPT